jgi:serine/threonine-protein kinase
MMNVNPPTFLKPGAHFDAYRIREWKGGGSYGDVYSCVREGRPYALKMAKHRYSSDDPGKTYQRLLRELVCLVHLDHPNIIKVLGWSRTPEGYGYLLLEYVDGWTLADWLQHQRPTLQQVLRVFAKLADALAYMHRRGVKHRDVSPSNVMVRRADGEPVIIDLGAGDYSGAYELTEAPLPPGTNRYRSPEAALFFAEHKNNPSARYDFPAEDDLYSLAVCLYDALTDAEPARKKERKAPRINVNSPTFPPPPARTANPRVPEVLSGWVERWLTREVEQRRTALTAMPGVLAELSRQGGEEWGGPVHASEEAGPPALEPTPAGTRRRVGAVAVAAALLAAVAVAVLAWPRPAPSPQAPPAEAAPESAPGPRETAPGASPSQPAPAASAVPSPSEVSPVKKESPPVSPSPNPASSETAATPSKKPAPVLPKSLKTGVLAGVCAAGVAGCPGAQVTPTRGETCPPAAVAAMERRRLDEGDPLSVVINPKQPRKRSSECKAENRWRDDVRTGCFTVVGDGEVVSEVSDGTTGLPEGTRLYGRLWTNGDEVVGRYTRAVVPEGADYGLERDFPVCIALGDNGGTPKYSGSKPGAAIVEADAFARPIHGRWP